LHTALTFVDSDQLWQEYARVWSRLARSWRLLEFLFERA